VPLKRRCREFKVTPDALLPVGTPLTAAHFAPGQYVDIQGARPLRTPPAAPCG
jgi:large subunit ribosomal protein L3